MSIIKNTYDLGRVSGYLIAVISLSILSVGMASFAIWAYVNYDEQKTDVDGKVAIAVAEAKREQAEEDEAKFAEREKQPNRVFVGPDDYGRLTFSYPKTWSTFVEQDASRGREFSAYLHRDVVPPISKTEQYMLRVLIESRDYNEVASRYEKRVEKGDLRASTTNFNGHTAARFDGNISNDIRGAVVVFRIRDKTVTLQTDADQYKPDFDALIQTVDFNQ